MNYLIVIFSWGIYLFLHSYLAGESVKEKLQAGRVLSRRSYRLLYSLLSVLGLMALILLMAVLESHLIFIPNQLTTYLGLVLGAWGTMIISLSFRKISMKIFLGLAEEHKQELVRSGIHGKIRHPIYSGTLLVLLGLCLYRPTDLILISAGVIVIYLPIGIRLEERKLVRFYGKDYLEYKKDVPALLPKFW